MKNYSIFKHSFCTLSLFIVMLLHAGVTYAQEKLRISFSNVSLEEALKKIESASKYTFFYDDKRTDLSQKVSANANGQSIEEVLNAMLKTTTHRLLASASFNAIPRTERSRIWTDVSLWNYRKTAR